PKPPCSIGLFGAQGLYLCIKCGVKDLFMYLCLVNLAQIQALGAKKANGTGRFWRITSPERAVSQLWGTMHSSLPVILGLPEKGAEWLRRTDDDVLVERNQVFLEAARPGLQEGGVLMATGRFHLPLDTGMIALLRGPGYLVERVALEGDASA
ncbi:MAG: TraB/GumN family protein, partial [Pseudomonadota bacterium]